ncbi:hypothetical protein IM538_05595 [Cytobacillus suaedae]|nr:hypothetical protein IM538_05595 [Cytobacillus suaedae]
MSNLSDYKNASNRLLELALNKLKEKQRVKGYKKKQAAELTNLKSLLKDLKSK